VYNGADVIAESVARILEVLERSDRTFELIVVSDGSTDGTADAVESLGHTHVRLLQYPHNNGKGFALAHGIARARGRYVGWIDADLDIEPDVLLAAIEILEGRRFDAAIASKRHPESDVVYPRVRRIYSWCYQMLVRILFRVRARDTQVGAKLFRREMLETVGPLLLVKRYAFDLEVLAVGADFGFDRIQEVPVSIHHRFKATGIGWGAVVNMLVDTLAVAYRIHIRHWYVRRYASLQRHRLDDTGAGAELAFADDPRDAVVT
jgi:dolichol-phosphate mannosyltransferase